MSVNAVTPDQAHARMIELRKAIALCREKKIEGLIPDYEKEWTQLRDTYMRQAYP